MKMLAKAIALAAEVFKDKVDKQGMPYVLHLINVMSQVGYEDEDEAIAAVLHDLLEDFPEEWTPQRLRDEGFSDRAILFIQILTHKEGEDYLTEYIPLCAVLPQTKRIKKADLRHNSDIMRLKRLREKDFKHIQKYHTAYVYLSS